MRKITVSGAARRFLMVVIGATLATSAIGLFEAAASTKSYQVNGRWYSPHGSSGYDEQGTASHYGPGFHGRKTANGETYDQWGMTAAHKTLPLGSQVFVTNQRTGKTVKVRINDRGPFVGGRIIDLSTHVAEVLGINGLGQVRVRNAAPGNDKTEKRVIASKSKDDDDKSKRSAKVKVASLAEPEDKPKAKPAAPRSQKVETKPVPRAKAPADDEERPTRYKHEVKEWGGMADASALGGDIASQRLVRKLESFAVAEVQAEWRKALGGTRKS